MELSLSKLPWYAQIGAFVLVSAGAVYGFWHFYVSEIETDMAVRQSRLDGAPGRRGARESRRRSSCRSSKRRSPSSRNGSRRSPGDPGAEGRRRHPAAHPGARGEIESVDPALSSPARSCSRSCTQEIPYKLQAEGRFTTCRPSSITGQQVPPHHQHQRDLDQGEGFGRSERTIVAECVATTFVLQEGALGPAKGAAIPKQPSLNQ
jgi:hypothetical protein